MKRRNYSYLGICIFASVLFLPIRVCAQTATSLTLTPAVIEINLKPGQIKNDKITVTNTGKQPLGVGINLSNVTPNEAEGLEVELKKPDWVTLSESTILLNAGESRQIEIVTSPNKKTPPGGYYGIVYFQAAMPTSTFRLGATTAIPKLGAFLLIDVKGKSNQSYETVRETTYPLFTSQKIPEASFTIKNTGNVHLIPKGHIEFEKKFSDKTYKSAFPPVLILPSTSREVKIPAINKVESGVYKVKSSTYQNEEFGFVTKNIGYMVVLGNARKAFATIGFIILALVAGILVVKRKNLTKALRILAGKDPHKA